MITHISLIHAKYDFFFKVRIEKKVMSYFLYIIVICTSNVLKKKVMSHFFKVILQRFFKITKLHIFFIFFVHPNLNQRGPFFLFYILNKKWYKKMIVPLFFNFYKCRRAKRPNFMR